MVRAEIRADSLESYYTQLRAAQEKAHGSDYCAYHETIRECSKGCETYAELGVNEGGSLAAALLADFRMVIGVDVFLDPIRPVSALFFDYARSAGKQVLLVEADSRKPALMPDMLFIDSNHATPHVERELSIHGPGVQRFILMHDTGKYRELHPLAERWAKANGWRVSNRSLAGTGHTLLVRG